MDAGTDDTPDATDDATAGSPPDRVDDAATGELVHDDRPSTPMAAAREIAGKLEQSLVGLTRLTVDDVFAAPTRVGDRVVITAANVRRQGGFGFGAGTARDDRDADGVFLGDAAGGRTDETGGGGGGGGGADARPVAVISVDASGVHVKPILDMTKIGLTLLTAGLTIWRTLRKS